jgi:hypothetical protein
MVRKTNASDYLTATTTAEVHLRAIECARNIKKLADIASIPEWQFVKNARDIALKTAICFANLYLVAKAIRKSPEKAKMPYRIAATKVASCYGERAPSWHEVVPKIAEAIICEIKAAALLVTRPKENRQRAINSIFGDRSKSLEFVCDIIKNRWSEFLPSLCVTSLAEFDPAELIAEIELEFSHTQTNGKVDAPGIDLSAYRPASEFYTAARMSLKKLKRIVKKEGIKTYHSSPQRLLVHAAQWQAYLTQKKNAEFASLGASPDDISDAITEASRVQTAYRKKKMLAGEKKSTSRLLAKLTDGHPENLGKS